MKIEEFEVENFRSILSESLTLHDFNILIGKNNAGKSNLASSIHKYRDLFCGETPATLHEECVTRGREDSPIEFRVRFTISESTRQDIVDRIASDTQLPAETFDIYSDGDSFSEFSHDIAIRRNGISRNSIQTNIQGETVEVGTIAGSPPEWTAEILSIDELPDIERETRSYHGAGPSSFKILPDPISRPLLDQFENWQLVAPFRQPSERGTFGVETELDPSGGNLTTVLHALRGDGTNRFQVIKDTYLDIMEGVTDIRIATEETDGSAVPQIRVDEETSNGIRLEELSSGSKEILILITKIVSSISESPLLFIEEPELHLHPAAEREIYDLIVNKVGESNTQTIVTSHSDIFVDEVDVEKIFSVKRDENTYVETVREGDLGKELASLGYSKSEFIQADRVIFVEGRSDRAIIQNWANSLGKSFAEYGVEAIVFNGDDLFEEDNPYANAVPDVLGQLAIPYLYIFDSDEKNPEEKKEEILGKLGESPSNIHILDQYSIESYLCQSARAVSKAAGIPEQQVQEDLPSNPEERNMKSWLNNLYQEELGISYSEESNGAAIANQMTSEEIADEIHELIDEIVTMEGRS